MGSHPTLPRDATSAWDTLKTAEANYRDGLIPDRDLHAARAGWQPYTRHPNRWAQPTVAELRARGDHGEADRIAGLQRWLAGRHAEHTFDRLNPTFGVPADRTDPIGHHDLAQRERALALGVRVAVHDTRQNDPNPAVWQPDQDYRAAEAIQAARAQLVRTRHGPERVGPER
jgi:hypothetical protein